jgi:hypothetical protein
MITWQKIEKTRAVIFGMAGASGVCQSSGWTLGKWAISSASSNRSSSEKPPSGQSSSSEPRAPMILKSALGKTWKGGP